MEHPIRLDEPRFTTSQIVRLSGCSDKSIRNWTDRNIVSLGERHFTGRVVYSLLDAIRLAVMHDLTTRVPMKPTDAAGAAELLARYVAEHSPHDDAGHPVADVNAIPRGLAYAMIFGADGKPLVGLVNPDQPGGYADFRGTWGRAHIVLPIAAIVADVLYNLLADRVS